MAADLTPDIPATPAKAPLPTKPGYYWAKWRIAADGTHEGDDLTPSNFWELVEVNDNNGEPGSDEQFSVAVPGVRETQWPDCFVWGDFVAPLAGIEKAHPPLNAAHVAALTTQLEVERATGDETARHISRLLDHLARETARADAAEAEAKALREAAEPFVRAADAAERNCFPLDGAVFRSALDYDMRALGRDNSEDVYRDSVRTSDLYRLRSIVTRATLAQPAADGGK